MPPQRDLAQRDPAQKDPHLFYETHVFCCINERPCGHPRGCCKEGGAEKLQNYMKAKLKALQGEGRAIDKTIRINKSGCLDRCELGPVMVIYPEGVWYQYTSTEDVDEILETHVLGGGRVKRLMLSPDQ